MDKNVHLYIHIPFCDSKCGYCAFYSEVGRLELLDSYFVALKKDLKCELEKADSKAWRQKSIESKGSCRMDSKKIIESSKPDTKSMKISSIFIGGGTPNIAKPYHYRDIFEILTPMCDDKTEISVEANPNLLTKKWLVEMKAMGVNRLSLGVQSFFDDKLALLERVHNKKDVNNALKIARENIENLSLDLIIDTALDSKRRVEIELEKALKLDIEHLSVYSLSVDSNSLFGSRFDNDEPCSAESLCYFARDFLLQNGFIHYEVSNFARVDPNLSKVDSAKNAKKCLHNLNYWRGAEYLACGASAVGRVGLKRYSAQRSIESYIANPLQKRIETLSLSDLDFESIFLGLRSEVGVSKEKCDKTRLKILLNENLCYERGSKIFARDYFLADSMAVWVSSF